MIPADWSNEHLQLKLVNLRRNREVSSNLVGVVLVNAPGHGAVQRQPFDCRRCYLDAWMSWTRIEVLS